jgi:hypothetical protein
MKIARDWPSHPDWAPLRLRPPTQEDEQVRTRTKKLAMVVTAIGIVSIGSIALSGSAGADERSEVGHALTFEPGLI